MSGLSRRGLLLTTLASAGTMIVHNEGLRAQEAADAQRLRETVVDLADHLGAQSDGMQDWLKRSEIVQAAARQGFHGHFDNRMAFKSNVPFEWSTPFEGDGAFASAGVDGHVWMSSRKPAPKWADLNSAEMSALLRDANYIGRKESLYTNGELIPIALPFPIGPRQPPNFYDYLEFDVVRLFPEPESGHGAGIRPLQYVRHFGMGFRNKRSHQSFPLHVVAYGYSEPTGRLGVFYQLRWT
jgi:hypothetical protein